MTLIMNNLVCYCFATFTHIKLIGPAKLLGLFLHCKCVSSYSSDLLQDAVEDIRTRPGRPVCNKRLAVLSLRTVSDRVIFPELKHTHHYTQK